MQPKRAAFGSEPEKSELGGDAQTGGPRFRGGGALGGGQAFLLKPPESETKGGEALV